LRSFACCSPIVTSSDALLVLISLFYYYVGTGSCGVDARVGDDDLARLAGDRSGKHEELRTASCVANSLATGFMR
jgi:hypothetical protein